ncbi:MAG: fluoride efflux transporter CrcB [Fluviicola sp. XM-24bin1]|nr:MAG: fluoride efflux transporter CrcB [Fluviicola sp. XM-24bin1]
MTYLWIFIGGGLGSVARYGVSKAATNFYSGNFPLGTFLSNILACLILALLIVFVVPKNSESTWLQPLLLVGFCGGFSTFSTFSNETTQLLQSGNTGVALLNIAVSAVVGVGLIFWIRSLS